MALSILGEIEGISVINFTKQDIVRNKLVTRIVEAYSKSENKDIKDNI